ncbi:MAG: O-antigen ligase C-terminal domain-containing protein [Proteobacteria bacterium]|nr:O-antigen ligase C-terminal domain-containing protein [Pseudomonadota bacterium]
MPSLVAAFLLIALPWLNPFAPGPSAAAVPLMFSWACAALLLVLCVHLPRRALIGALVSAAAWAWLVAGLISSLIGVAQYLGLGGQLLPWVNEAPFGQAFGNLRQRNQFATLTCIALAALLWLATAVDARAPTAAGAEARERDGEAEQPAPPAALLQGWPGWLAAALLAAGDAASTSRIGLLELVGLCLLQAIWGGWREPVLRRLLLAALAGYLLASLFLPWIDGFGPFGNDAFARLRGGAGCQSRLILWANVLHLIGERPLAGWGWGQLAYAQYITLFSGPRFCDLLDNAHDLPLQLAFDFGVPAALLVCAAFAWWVLRQRPWAEMDARRRLAWSVVALILLHSLVEYPLWYGPFQTAFALSALWLLHTAPRQSFDKKQAAVPALSSQRAITAIATATLTLLILAAIDYWRVSQIYLPTEQRAAAYQDDALAAARGAWLFRGPARFALLTLTDATPQNALFLRRLAEELLHYSPEPRVIEKLIESDLLLGRDEDARFHLARFRAAWPKECAAWLAKNPGFARTLAPLPGATQ